MDFKQIRRLVKLVESSQIEEIEIKEEGFQIRVVKNKNISQIPVPNYTSGNPVSLPSDLIHVRDETQKAAAEALPAATPENQKEILSPMVGTFYQASAPDTPPFVKEGDVIQPGRILCIIEAMKLMNEIESEISGKIIKILIENGQPVEYNQPLFLVEIG